MSSSGLLSIVLAVRLDKVSTGFLFIDRCMLRFGLFSLPHHASNGPLPT